MPSAHSFELAVNQQFRLLFRLNNEFSAVHGCPKCHHIETVIGTAA